VLGPQQRPTVDAVVRALELADGPFGMVTAGWLERESDDGELAALLGGRAVGLGLYQRWRDVQERDPEYAAAERALSDVLGELDAAYLLRLDYALQAVYALQRRGGPAGSVADEALGEAIGAVRELDEAHARRVSEARAEFAARLRPQERPVVTGHRAAVAGLLSEAAALVIAGGHVGVLAGVLGLFGVAAASRGPVIAWSAGAMALTDRIVLFADRSAHGPGHPEVYGRGLGLVPGVVLLPHARSRLLLDDTPRMAVFARRFAPARCVLLDAGARAEFPGPLAGTRILAEDGRVRPAGARP
jgi:hypothetical protein